MGVKQVTFYKTVPTLQRLYAWPFILTHLINLIMLVSLMEPSIPPHSRKFTACESNLTNASASNAENASCTASATAAMVVGGGTAGSAGVEFWGYSLPLWNAVLLPVLLVLQLLAWLGTHWSVNFNSLMTLSRVRTVEEAGCVMVVPSKPTQKVVICNVEQVALRNKSSRAVETVPSFEFQKRRYLWEAGEKKWQKVAFPVRESMAFYTSSRGLADSESIGDAAARYGLNSFEIPLPTFKELYMDQCRQPFFVFQVGCVSLWSMDEYWYYSIFTLLMLLLFEGTVVLSRTRNLRMVRDMMGAPTIVRVFRAGAWISLTSNMLVPGDIISVKRNKHDADETGIHIY